MLVYINFYPLPQLFVKLVAARCTTKSALLLNGLYDLPFYRILLREGIYGSHLMFNEMIAEPDMALLIVAQASEHFILCPPTGSLLAGRLYVCANQPNSSVVRCSMR